MINPAQYWWDHLTRRQQLFLLFYPIPASLYLSSSVEEEKIKIWYQFALTNDLHSLPHFPETRIDDLRRI